MMDKIAQDVLDSIKVLASIADRYDANSLDDEARKWWGTDEDPVVNTRDPASIILYTSRGGATLLTLADCMKARNALRKIVK